MIWELDGIAPQVAADAWVAPDAQLMGRVVLEDGASVWLGDVAEIEIGQQSYGSNSRFSGQNASGFGVNLETGANAVDTASGVRAVLDGLQSALPEGVEVRWLTNPGADAAFLARAVDAVDWREAVQVFAHGERESIKAVRRVLKARGVPREAISISGYWARGRTEDAFQAEFDRVRRVVGGKEPPREGDPSAQP